MALRPELHRRGLIATALLAAAAVGCGAGPGRGDRAERRRRRQERRAARAEVAAPSPAPPPAVALEAHAAAAALDAGDLDGATARWSAACAAGHPDACRMEARWTRRRALGLPLPSPPDSP